MGSLCVEHFASHDQCLFESKIKNVIVDVKAEVASGESESSQEEYNVHDTAWADMEMHVVRT